MSVLVLRQLRKRPWRFLPALPFALLALVASPTGTLRPWANRALVRLSLRAVSDEQYSKLALGVGRSLAADTRIEHETAVQALREFEGRAIRIVVTASELRLARSYLDALGFSDVTVLASTITQSTTGMELRMHNVGWAKVRRLREDGLPIAEAEFYTDSASDLPLAKAVRRTVLVNPSRRSLRRFEREACGDFVLLRHS